MDNYNEQSDFFERKGSFESENMESSAVDAQFETIPQTTVSEHSENNEAAAPAASAISYEPDWYVEKYLKKKNGKRKEKKQKKERQPRVKRSIPWMRVFPVLIATAAVFFITGVFFSVQVLYPYIQTNGLPEFSIEFNGKKPFENNDDKKDTPVQKEAESYSEHPSELPKIGGELPTITDTNNPVPDIAEQLTPGVVLITSKKILSFDDGSERTSNYSSGTGFVISADGYIVTNSHVISGASSFVVTMSDEQEYEAMLVGTDSETDLAVLKIEPRAALTVLPIGDSDSLRVGEMVITIGNAAGAGKTLVGSVTVGYISSCNRELSFNGTQQTFIQTDAAMNSGNSGGPLISVNGEVIGIVTLKSIISSYMENGQTVNSEGLGFAIPINRALDKINDIIMNGSIKKPGVGFTYIEITEEEAKNSDLPCGLMIYEFMTDSPAEKAGMLEGDIVIAVDDIPISEIESIVDYIGNKGIGKTIKLTVDRESAGTLDFNVEIVDINAIR